MTNARTSQPAFFATSALLFAGSAALTSAWCTSMSSMMKMPMPGGWSMSMTWMRMPGQSWPGAAASFLGMWMAMMVAMMLPSLAPQLWRYYRAAEAAGDARPGRLTAVVGAGFFSVWGLSGVAVFAIGSAVAQMEMRQAALARAAPIAAGLVVLLAGGFQFTELKARHLVCCRRVPPGLAVTSVAAWRQGLRLGLDCNVGCAGLTAILLVTGVMDLRAMSLVTVAITAERLAADGARVARMTGYASVVAGSVMIARASLGF